MELRAGQKLFSAVCEAQFVVVRPPSSDVEIGCGGAPVLDHEAGPDEAAQLDPALSDGPLMGKRYADADLGLELLCSRPGKGTLTVDGKPLLVKGAAPLPSSD